MYIVDHEGFGSRHPPKIEYHPTRVAVHEGIYSEEHILEDGTVETVWFAAKTTFYTKEEYQGIVDESIVLSEARAVTEAYENTIELIEEMRPE